MYLSCPIKRKMFWLETLPCVYGGKKSSFMYQCKMKNVLKKKKRKSLHAKTCHAMEWCWMTKRHLLKSSVVLGWVFVVVVFLQKNQHFSQIKMRCSWQLRQAKRYQRKWQLEICMLHVICLEVSSLMSKESGALQAQQNQVPYQFCKDFPPFVLSYN